MENTPKMEKRILDAADASSEVGSLHSTSLTADFEHGRWFVTCLPCGAQWSVVDAVGGRSVDGFDFERITEGDGSCEEEREETECTACRAWAKTGRPCTAESHGECDCPKCQGLCNC